MKLHVKYNVCLKSWLNKLNLISHIILLNSIRSEVLNNLASGKWRYQKSAPDLLRSTVVYEISSVLSFKGLNILFRDTRTSADEKKEKKFSDFSIQVF